MAKNRIMGPIKLEDLRSGIAVGENVPAPSNFFPGIEPLGKYDVFLRPEYNQETERGQNQSTIGKLFNGALRSAINVGTKSIQSIGGAAGLIEAAFTGDMTNVYDNAIGNFGRTLENIVKEELPVYQSEKAMYGSIGEKFLSSSFIADTGFDALSFAASAYLTGAAMQGLGVAKAATGAYSKLAKVLETAEKATKFGSKVEQGAVAFFNTVGEASIESRGVYDGILKQTGDKELAKAGADETFLANLVALAVPNVVQAKWISRALPSKRSALQQLAKEGIKLSFSPKEIAKAAAEGLISEGLWEENIQTSIERYENKFAAGKTKAGFLDGVAEEYGTNIKGFLKTVSPFHKVEKGSAEEEGALSIIMGGVIGSPMSVYSGMQQHLVDSEYMSKWQKMLKDNDSSLKAAKKILNSHLGNVFEMESTKDSKGNVTGQKFKRSNEGKLIPKQGAVDSQSSKVAADFARMGEGLNAVFNNDPLLAEFNTTMGELSLAYFLSTDDNIDEENIQDYFDLMSSDLGTATEVKDTKEIVDNTKSFFKDIMKLKSDIASKYEFSDDKYGKQVVEDIQKLYIYNHGKKEALSRMLEKEGLSEKNKDVISELISDLEVRNRELKTRSSSLIEDTVKVMEERAAFSKRIDEGKEISSEETLKATLDLHLSGAAELLSDSPGAPLTALTVRRMENIHKVNAPSRVSRALDKMSAAFKGDKDTSEVIEKYVRQNERFIDEKDVEPLLDKAEEILDRSKEQVNEEMKAEIAADPELAADPFAQMDLREELEKQYAHLPGLIKSLKSVKAGVEEVAPLTEEELEDEVLNTYWLNDAIRYAKQYEKRGEDFSENLTYLARALEDTEVALRHYKGDAVRSKRLSELKATLEKALITAAENAANRSKKAKEQETIKYELLKSVLLNDPDFKSLLESTLGEEFIKKVEEFTTAETADAAANDSSIAKFYVLLDEIKKDSKLSKEFSKKVKEKIATLQEEVLDKAGITNFLRDIYVNAPVTGFNEYIIPHLSRMSGKPMAGIKGTPFYEFEKTGSPTDLATTTSKAKDGAVHEVAAAHKKVLTLKGIEGLLESKHDLTQIFETLIKSKTAKDFPLTPQQLVSAVEGVAYLTSKNKLGRDLKTSSNAFDNETEYLDAVKYLPGHAGTGKTKAVAKQIMQAVMSLEGIEIGEIIGLSNNKGASDNLRNALGLEDYGEVDDFTSNNFSLKSAKLIILDEAAAFYNDKATAILKKVREENKTREEKDRISILALGDIDQITPASIPLFLQGERNMTPLTVPLRNVVGAIASTALEFRGEGSKITEVETVANVSLTKALNSSTDLKGVLGGIVGSVPETIKTILSKRAKDGLKRVILISDERKRALYDGIDNAEVKMYQTFNGQEADEVYIDIQEDDYNFGNKPFIDFDRMSNRGAYVPFNNAIYTAISRATKFAYVGSDVIKSTESPRAVETDESSAKELIMENELALQTSISEFRQVMQALKNKAVSLSSKTTKVPTTPTVVAKKKVPPTPEEIEEKEKEAREEEEKEANIVNTPEEAPEKEETPENLPVSTTPQKLRYPDEVKKTSIGKTTTTTVKHKIAFPQARKISAGDVGQDYHVVKVEGYDSPVIITNNNKWENGRSVIIPNEWKIIGVLGDVDMATPFGKIASQHITDFEGNHIGRENYKERDKTIFTLSEGQFKSYFSGPITKARKLTYVYDKENPSLGKDIFAHAVDLFVKGFFEETQLEQSPRYKELLHLRNDDMSPEEWVNILIDKGIISFHQMTNADVNKQGGKFYEDAKRLNLFPGVTYMVLENVQSEHNSSTTNTREFIKLANAPFNKNSKDYAPLKKFQDLLNKITEKLEAIGDPAAAQVNSNNYRFTMLVEAFSQQYGLNPQDGTVIRKEGWSPAQILAFVKDNYKNDKAFAFSEKSIEAITHELHQMVEMLYGAKTVALRTTKEEFKTQFTDNPNRSGDYEWVPFTKGGKGKVYQMTTDVNGRAVRLPNPITTSVLVRTGGEVQKAWNNLALENRNTVIKGKPFPIAIFRDLGNGKTMRTGARVLQPIGSNVMSYWAQTLREEYENVIGKSPKGLEYIDMIKALIEHSGNTEEYSDYLFQVLSESIKPNVGKDVLSSVLDPLNSEVFHSAVREEKNLNGEMEQNLFYLREPINNATINHSGSNEFSAKAYHKRTAKNAARVVKNSSGELEVHGNLMSSLKEVLPMEVELQVSTTKDIGVEETSPVVEEKKLKVENVVENMAKETPEAPPTKTAKIISEAVEEVTTEEELNKITENLDEAVTEEVEKEFKKKRLILENKSYSELYSDARSMALATKPLETSKALLETLDRMENIYGEKGHKHSKADTEGKQRLLKFIEKVSKLNVVKFSTTDSGRLQGAMLKEEARNLALEMLPQLNGDEHGLKFLEEEAFFKALGEVETGTWGFVEDGTIFIRLNKEGKAYESVLMHEVVHRVFRHHLSSKEKSRLLKSISKVLKKDATKMSEKELEEELAILSETWKESKPKGIYGRLKNFLNKVLSVFNLYLDSHEVIEDFFKKIKTGSYANRDYHPHSGSKARMSLLFNSFSGDTWAFDEALFLVKSEFNKILNTPVSEGGGVDGLVVSDEEAINRVYLKLKAFTRRYERELADTKEELETADEIDTPLLEAVISGIENKLGVAKKLFADPKVYKKLIEYVYPTWTVQLNQENLDVEVSDRELGQKLRDAFEANPEQDTVQTLENVIRDNAEVNREASVTHVLRHWLTGMTIKQKTGLESMVSNRFAFFSMMYLVNEINLGDLNTLGRRIEDYINRTQVSPGLAAVIDRFSHTLTKAEYRSYYAAEGGGRTSNKYVTIVSDNNAVTHKQRLYIAHVTDPIADKDIDLSSIDIIEEVKYNPELKGKVSLIPIKNGKLKDAYETINEDVTPMSKEEFNSIYETHKSRDIIRTIQNVFGSMKELNLGLSYITYDYGKVKFRYSKGKNMGLSTSISDDIESAFSSLMEQGYAKDRKTGKVLLKRIRDLNSSAGKNSKFKNRHSRKQEIIHKFLEDLGVGPFPEINFINEDSIIAEIRYSLERAATLPSKYTEEQFETMMADNGGLYSKLSKTIAMSGEYLKAGVMKDGKNNSVFKMVNSDFLERTYKSFRNSSLFKGVPGGKSYLGFPSFLKGDFYKNNIFVSGTNKIYDMIFNDSTKNTLSNSAVAYSEENNERKLLNRIFTGQFLGGLSSVGRELTYWQQAFVLADRGKIPAFKVKLKKVSEIKEDLIPLIQQQVNSRNKALEETFKGFSVDSSVNIVSEETLSKSVDTIIDIIIKEGVTIPSNLRELYGKVKGLLEEEIPKIPQNYSYKNANKESVVKASDIRPLVELLVYNHYINSYFLNQLFFNDYAFYKNKAAVLKRGAGVSAAATTPLVGKFGMKKTGRYVFVNDAVVHTDYIKPKEGEELTEEEIAENKRREAVGTMRDFFKRLGATEEEVEIFLEQQKADSEITDATSYFTNARAAQLKKGFGRSFGIGRSTKPVYFGMVEKNFPLKLKENGYNLISFKTQEELESWINNTDNPDLYGIFKTEDSETPYHVSRKESFPIYVKTAGVQLTEHLTEKYPLLKKVEEYLNEKQGDELVFGSAVKVGLPKNIPGAEQIFAGDTEGITFLDLPNEHLGMQGTPIHRPAGKIKPFSQLLSFLNTVIESSQNNQIYAQNAYKATAFLLKKGIAKVRANLENKGITKMVVDALSETDDVAIIDAIKKGVSLNNPALERYSTMKLASNIFKNTMRRVKFSGGKYTLQTAWGITMGDKKSDVVQFSSLKYNKEVVDGKTFITADAIIPKGSLPTDLETRIKKGEPLYMYGDAVAFRIPSSEMHSGAVLRIVDTYDDQGTNIIIVPREIVNLHGSDFDVDALFVINKEVNKQDIVVKFNDLGQNINGKESYTFYKKNFPIGFRKGKKGLVFNHEKALVLLEKDNKKLDKLFQDEQIDLKEYERVKKSFNRYEEQLALNVISESLLQALTDSNNFKRIMTSISLERIMGDKETSIKSYIEALAGKQGVELNPKDDGTLTTILGAMASHKSVFDGEPLIGVFANATKVLANIVTGGYGEEYYDAYNAMKLVEVDLENFEKAHEKEMSTLSEKDSEEYDRLLEYLKEKEKAVKTLKSKAALNYPEFNEVFSIGEDDYFRLTERENGENVLIWETLDALINLATDNVKEQGLFLIGANRVTAVPLSVMVGAGVPLKDAVLMIKQPIVQELNRAKYFNTDIAIKKLLKDLGDLATDKEVEVTLDMLEKQVFKYFDSDKIKDWDEQDINERYAVLREFEKINTIGGGLKDLAQIINILREPPSTPEGVFKLQDVIIKVFGQNFKAAFEGGTKSLQERLTSKNPPIMNTEEDFPIRIQGLFSKLPHLSASMEVVNLLASLLRENYIVHSGVFDNLLEAHNIFNTVDLAAGTDDLRTKQEYNKILVKKEYLKFLMTNILPDYIFNNDYLEVKTDSGASFTINSSEAWRQQILTLLKDIKNDPEFLHANNVAKDNYFLKHLGIKGANDRFKTARYTGNVNAATEDKEYAKWSFSKLANIKVYTDAKGNIKIPRTAREKADSISLVRALTYYSILDSGLAFNLTGFSNLLPSEELLAVDKEINKIFNKIDKAPWDVKNTPLFLAQLLASEAEGLSYVPSTIKPLKLTKMLVPGSRAEKGAETEWGESNKGKIIVREEKGNKTYYYDLAFKKTKESKQYLTPYIRQGVGKKAKSYKQVFKNDNYVLYQFLGRSKAGYTPSNLEKEYRMSDYYSAEYPTLRYKDIKLKGKEGLVDLSYMVSKGDNIKPIALTTFKDVGNQDRIWVKLTSSKLNASGTSYIYNFEQLPPKGSPALEKSIKEDSKENKKPSIGGVSILGRNTYTVEGLNATGVVSILSGIIANASPSLMQYKGMKLEAFAEMFPDVEIKNQCK